MKCNYCGSEDIIKKKIYAGRDSCRDCPDPYIPNRMFGKGIKVQGKRRTVAHDADISRRRLADDGVTVYRDYGRKSIII